jgi:predicted TIM-barrel fold metal-dependent hydrolase
MGTPPQREFTHRLDAIDGSGRVGTDPLFAKAQVLDAFDLTAAVLTSVSPFPPAGPNRPGELARAINQAFNDALCETWLDADPRYYGSISLARDLPDIEQEIRRCKEGPYGDRFVQVLISPAGAEPLGRPRYWKIFEVAAHYNLPIACHVPPMGPKGTAGGAINYYCELHMNLAAYPMTIIPSMVFEGVFDRFPTLKLALIELGWSFAPMLGWRLDRIQQSLRGEVGHLRRRASEYMRDHVWYATQPIEEPERPEHLDGVYRMMEESGFGANLMYASDYPHWDFDAPTEVMSGHHPMERRRRILGENASKLYGIPLLPNSGILAHPQAKAA